MELKLQINMYAYHAGGHILMNQILGITRHGSLEMKIAQRTRRSNPFAAFITLELLYHKGGDLVGSRRNVSEFYGLDILELIMLQSLRIALILLVMLWLWMLVLVVVGAKHVYAVEASEMPAYACKLTVVTTIDHLSTKLWFESILPHLLQYGACPGLKVLAPYSSEDARGLLKATIRDPDPVVFLENELLYGESFPILAKVLDFSVCLPIGKAKATEILAKEGISAEIFPQLGHASVWNTSRLVTVEEGCPQHGVGAEICGKAFTAKRMQVLELVGKETMDLLITETGIEVDKKGAQAQDDEDQLFEEVTFDRCFYIYEGIGVQLIFSSSSEIDGSATASENGKKIEIGAEGSADEMKNLHNSSVKKAAEMAAGRYRTCHKLPAYLSAVGMTHMVGNMTIYGYVDCTRDVNGQDSTTCLLGATDSIPCSCLGKWAGWIATPTCNIQFNMDPVHDDWINPPEIDTNVATATTLVTEPSAPVDDGGLESSVGDGGDGNKEREVSYWLLWWSWHLF
ncbi:unnamed protein product [Camellia sinensis]